MNIDMVVLSFSLMYAIHVLKIGVCAQHAIDNVYIEPGGNVTLNCSFIRRNVQWIYKHRDENTPDPITISEGKNINKMNIKNHYQYKVYTDGEYYNLQITNATKSTEGKYWCFAANTTESYLYYYDVYLKAPPFEVTVINMTENKTIMGKEHRNLTLTCLTLGGVPRGKTIWYHGKKKLTMNNDDSEIAYYTLMLHRNHNEQIYTCIAEHELLRTPLNQSIKLDIMYYPRVELVWSKGHVSAGNNVNLSCSYFSNPLNAEISWTKNSQNIDYSHSIVTNIVVKNERNLTEIDLIAEDTHVVTSILFQTVTKTDEGSYTCNVTNSEGSASKTVFLAVHDNESETVSHSNPPFSGTSVKGFPMKDQTLRSVIVVVVVLVLIIMSLVGHAYIRIRCIPTLYTVPNPDVVRQTSFEIEMREITYTEHDENDSVRNQQSLTNQDDTLADDRHSELSTTHSRSSSSHSNRSQNMNEDDYLHPYHGFVHNSMDVHEYEIVDRHENAEYEEIADVSKT